MVALKLASLATISLWTAFLAPILSSAAPMHDEKQWEEELQKGKIRPYKTYDSRDFDILKRLKQADGAYRSALLAEQRIVQDNLEKAYQTGKISNQMSFYLDEGDYEKYEELIESYDKLRDKKGQLTPEEEQTKAKIEKEMGEYEEQMDRQNKRMFQRIQGMENRYGKWNPATMTFDNERQLLERLKNLENLGGTTTQEYKDALRNLAGLDAAKNYMIEVDNHAGELDEMFELKDTKDQGFFTKLWRDIKHVFGLKNSDHGIRARRANAYVDYQDKKAAGALEQQGKEGKGVKIIEKDAGKNKSLFKNLLGGGEKPKARGYMEKIGTGYNKLDKDQLEYLCASGGAAPAARTEAVSNKAVVTDESAKWRELADGNWDASAVKSAKNAGNTAGHYLEKVEQSVEDLW